MSESRNSDGPPPLSVDFSSRISHEAPSAALPSIDYASIRTSQFDPPTVSPAMKAHLANDKRLDHNKKKINDRFKGISQHSQSSFFSRVSLDQPLSSMALGAGNALRSNDAMKDEVLESLAELMLDAVVVQYSQIVALSPRKALPQPMKKSNSLRGKKPHHNRASIVLNKSYNTRASARNDDDEDDDDEEDVVLASTKSESKRAPSPAENVGQKRVQRNRSQSKSVDLTKQKPKIWVIDNENDYDVKSLEMRTRAYARSTNADDEVESPPSQSTPTSPMASLNFISRKPSNLHVRTSSNKVADEARKSNNSTGTLEIDGDNDLSASSKLSKTGNLKLTFKRSPEDMLLVVQAAVTKLFDPRSTSWFTQPQVEVSGRTYSVDKPCDSYFGQIRSQYGITEEIMSKSVAAEIHGENSRGKSGSFFMMTSDKLFVIKSLTKDEFCFLLDELLNDYTQYILQHPDTLLPKFYGCIKIKSTNNSSKHVRRFIIMNNVFSTNFQLHEIFDIKGSSVGREASEKEKEKGNAILKDLDLVKMNRHFWFDEKLLLLLCYQMSTDAKFLAEREIMDYSLLIGVHILESALESKDDEAGEVVLPCSTLFQGDYGGMLARNKAGDPIPELYFVGIIDILQKYTKKKALENIVKSISHDKNEISAVDARFYARRFVAFILKYVMS